MIGQKVQPRYIPPCPPEFAQEFIAGGWRRVEMLYNCRTDLLLKWVDMCGGEDLYARRRAARFGAQQAAVQALAEKR
jgi:hypothetical protein